MMLLIIIIIKITLHITLYIVFVFMAKKIYFDNIKKIYQIKRLYFFVTYLSHIFIITDRH